MLLFACYWLAWVGRFGFLLAWLPEHGDLSGQNLLHHMVFICHGPFQLGGQCTDGLMLSLTGKAIGQLAISCQRIWQVEHPVPLSNHANRWKCFVESGQRLFYDVEKRSPCQKLDYGLTGACGHNRKFGTKGLAHSCHTRAVWSYGGELLQMVHLLGKVLPSPELGHGSTTSGTKT